jgi:eukaryotic-like serine/threonine-protein kinase
MGTEQTIAGYKVLGTLGHGAASTIYRVEDPADGKVYALKQVVRRGTQDQRFIDQLETEYATATALSHPALRKCVTVKRKRLLLRVREACLVMEHVDGHSLTERRPPTLLYLVRAFYIVAEALAAMNKAGFVHADIKPNNIMLDASGRVKIIDLGQSCPVGTIKERIQGTPDYIAPEQVRRRALTAQTDMFNFGASLYWCTTGRAVPTLIPKVDAQGNRVPEQRKYPRPSQINPLVPASLDKLIGDCLRTDPAKRPVSWDAVMEGLKVSHGQLYQSEQSNAQAQERPASYKEKSGTGEMCTV